MVSGSFLLYVSQIETSLNHTILSDGIGRTELVYFVASAPWPSTDRIHKPNRTGLFVTCKVSYIGGGFIAEQKH